MIEEKDIKKLVDAVDEVLEKHTDEHFKDTVAYWQLCTVRSSLESILSDYKENEKTYDE